MAKIKRFTEKEGRFQGQLGFHCPGCNSVHFINDDETDEIAANGIVWEFNKDFERPTISPSVLTWNNTFRCHSFIRNGQIQFLSDCTHKLAGQTVELDEI